MKKSTKPGIRIFGAVLFAVYITGLVYFLFFAEGYGRSMEAGAYDYNLLPFHEIMRYVRYRQILGWKSVFLNLAGNVTGFMPFGILLPVMVRSVRRAWKIGLLGLEVSLTVEVVQLILRVGCFDVDDIILNTAGALIGYCVFLSMNALFSDGRDKKKRAAKRKKNIQSR